MNKKQITKLSKKLKSVIEEEWPIDDIEIVEICPYCTSTKKKLAYKDVQDWSFYGAPGKWNYWSCDNCQALYLNPRPTYGSINKAYATYYTHYSSLTSFKKKIKTYIKNECFSVWFNVNIALRLHIPKPLVFLTRVFKNFIHIPFELESLVALPKGKLLDVGCGDGNILLIAKKLGWNVTGLEIDPSAVFAARSNGLNVIEGDYSKLDEFRSQFDCIICSHVLEHVHQPLALIKLLRSAMKPNGILLLSLPNANSHLRYAFGENWRGLEAPRHIAIPTLEMMMNLLSENSFTDIKQKNVYGVTFVESSRISQRLTSLNMLNFLKCKLGQLKIKNVKSTDSDFIQLIAKNNGIS